MRGVWEASGSDEAVYPESRRGVLRVHREEGGEMRILKFIERSAITAIKLPIALSWDIISLGNMGDGSSTEKVIREHEKMKREDEKP